MAFLTRGVDIELIDERPQSEGKPPKQHSFYFEGGVKSFVRYLNQNRNTLHMPIYVDQEIETTQVEAAIQYTDGYSDSLHAFANTINTPDGGTHLTGLRTAITRQVNDYARKQGFLKDNDNNFSGDDTRQGADGHRQRQGDRATVRGAEQAQAAQQRGALPRRIRGGERRGAVDGGESEGRQADH